MVKLVDVYGQPLKKEQLLAEQATPTVTGVRQILSEHPTSGLNPSRLGRILRRAEEGDAESYLAMAEELEEKDLHYLSVMGTRKRAVSQLEITVEPASDKAYDVANATLIEQWLQRDQLQDEMFDILDAVGKGFSQTEIIWDVSEKDWTVRDLVWRDPRWFMFDQGDGTTLYLRGDAGQKVPLVPNKFISHRPKAKSGLAIRGGLARPVSWMFLFKTFSVKDWVIFMEAYGQPIRVGKYGPGATPEDRKTLMKAVSSIASDAGAIIPESMQIEFIEAQGKTGTAEVFQQFVKFANSEISKAVLGQTMTTDDGSSRSQAEVHNEVRTDIEKADARQLAATLNRDLVRPLIDFNRGPQASYPRIQIGRAQDVDVDIVSQAAERFVKMGGHVSRKGLGAMLGLPEAESDDDQLATAPQANDDILPDPKTTEEKRPSVHHQAHHQGCPTCFGQDRAASSDAVDRFAAEVAADWERVMDPLVSKIEAMIADCETVDELSQRLAELGKNLSATGLAEQLAQASFAARIAARLGVSLEDEQ